MSVRFIESCPTCGRRIQFRVSLIGKTVACPHCQSEFTSGSQEASRLEAKESGVVPLRGITDPLMERVERMLAETQPGS